MQHFDMESTVYERGSLLSHFRQKVIFDIFDFFPHFGLYLPFCDRQHGTFLYGRTHIMGSNILVTDHCHLHVVYPVHHSSELSLFGGWVAHCNGVVAKSWKCVGTE